MTKQIQRSISMFLVCLMALCCLTACGGGSSTSKSKVDREVVVKTGASKNITEDSKLNQLATLTLDYTEKVLNVTEADEFNKLSVEYEASVKKLGFTEDDDIEVATGVGSNRDNAIANMVKENASAGKGATKCGMAEREVSITTEEATVKMYVVVVMYSK